MMRLDEKRPMLVAVTGAQGSGKTTFVQRLTEELTSNSRLTVVTLPSVGEVLKETGIKLGEAGTVETIVAVVTAHVKRENTIPSSDIAILDRCMVDMLAYIRLTRKSDEVYDPLFETLLRISSERLGVVLITDLKEELLNREAVHESRAFRLSVEQELYKIIREFSIKCNTVDIFSASHVIDMSNLILDLAEEHNAVSFYRED